MDGQWLIVVGLVLVAGSALQSAAGFGFGMFAIPVLVLLGAESYEAIATLSVCSAAQTLLGLFLLRRSIRWRRVLAMIVLASLTLPLGVAVLEHLTALEPHVVRRVFGSLVLAAVLVQWSWRVGRHDRVPLGWGVLAISLSGFMSGLAGMGGPPAVLWVMAHRWSTAESRATLWALFMGVTPLQLIVLHRQFGEEVLTASLHALLLVPAVLAGMIPGLWIGHRLSPERLRSASFMILMLIALYAIVQPESLAALR